MDDDTPITLGDIRRALAAHLPSKTPAKSVAGKKVGSALSDGFMGFIGSEIVSLMKQRGYPAKVFELYRSPERQESLFSHKPQRSKARAFQSAHQYWLAVDIVHPEKFWNVSAAYWDTLADCVKAVSEMYDVELNHGHFWKFTDSAHIEFKDWREVKKHMHTLNGAHVSPSEEDRIALFKRVLPKVAEKKGAL